MGKRETKFVLPEQKKVHDLVTQEYHHYYLTGGTALALHFNHRRSEDLDFFTQRYSRSEPPKIMDYISKKTGCDHSLKGELNDPKLVSMQSYVLNLKNRGELKIDFVQDANHNINKIEGGLHSVEDIYFRKIGIAVGTGRAAVNEIGRDVSSGRQKVKDVYDLYYLSRHYDDLPIFFENHFRPNQRDRLSSWYRSFPRMELITNLMDLETKEKIDTKKILDYLDQKILVELENSLGQEGLEL